MELWLIGAGMMAQAYAKVLRSLDQEFVVIGRNSSSARQFETAITGCPVRQGGVGRALRSSSAPSEAIIAVGVEHLAEVTTQLIEAGVRRILLEKPGGLNTLELRALQLTAIKHKAEVLIAYNRRFYAATNRARRLIAEDGGATSCVFEFTEWSDVIEPLTKGPGVKAAWFLANSTHVVDLAFHLCGSPKEARCWHGGYLSWHPSAAQFTGFGTTEHGVMFSYHADWEAPGRWGLEVLTRKHRFIFRPLEQLQIIRSGTNNVETEELDDSLDLKFKPGLHAQTKAFLQRDDRFFCTLDQQIRHCNFYDGMAGYNHGVIV